MLDEKALRREGFSEGPKVVLGDGQEWTFPLPWMRFYPLKVDGKFVAGGGRSYGQEYEDRLEEALLAEDLYARLSIQFELAAGLLLQNYALDEKALRHLLATDERDDSRRVMWEQIIEVLMGKTSPKASADGSDLPC